MYEYNSCCMKVIFALDSFKGSLTSAQANAVCANAVRSLYPDSELVELCVADGGEGTVDALAASYRCEWHTCDSVDPLGRPISTRYAIATDIDTAFIAVADASGLPLLAVHELNPMLASSYGTGLEMMHAIKQGCRHIVLGVGGSATVDGGTGLLQALGFRFVDDNGLTLGRGGQILEQIADIDSSNVPKVVFETSITVLYDVDIPLCGPNGAAHVFGPQKGASPNMVESLDSGFSSFAQLLGANAAEHAGAGAAGGIAASLNACLGAQLVPGANKLLEMIDFEHHLKGTDLLITGEGRIDATTLHGKLPYIAMQEATKHGIPTVALAGLVSDKDKIISAGFSQVVQIMPPNQPLTTAMDPAIASENLSSAILHLLLTNGEQLMCKVR